MTPEQYDKFLKDAFNAFLSARNEPGCMPSRRYLPYDAVDLKDVPWTALGEILVRDELRELINNLNSWLGSLRRWHAWQLVAAKYSEDDAWELEHEFIRPIATYCLFQPSAVRDAFTFVVTNGMHQVLIAADPTYRDRLELDQIPWEAPKHPTRRKKETQLAGLLGRWPGGDALLASLRQLDDQVTRHATSDFRNRASHSIPPRFMRGMTRAVTRSLAQATRMEKKDDGFFHAVPIPSQFVVCYGHGGTEALDLEEVRAINLKQFDVAASCFDHYISLLTTVTAGLRGQVKSARTVLGGGC